MKSERAMSLAMEMFFIFEGPAPTNAKLDAYERHLSKAEDAAERALASAQAGKCRDCKHWGWLYHLESEEEPRDYTPKRRCDRLKVSEAVCHDDIAETAPDFGCVLFETKEAM